MSKRFSYVHQYRDTDQEFELQDALVLAYSHSDQLENAWLLLTELESQRPEAQAWKAFFDALQTRGTDFEFLRYANKYKTRFQAVRERLQMQPPTAVITVKRQNVFPLLQMSQDKGRLGSLVSLGGRTLRPLFAEEQG